MSDKSIQPIGRCFVFSILAIACGNCSARAQWPGWGGPNRDFDAKSSKLADHWPEAGPKQVWSRDLGEGYSGIAVSGDRIYTMYRKGDDEIAVALDAKTGDTVWEYSYNAPLAEGMDPQFGKGPHATPLIHDGIVYTFGVTGHLHALREKDGEVVWSHDFIKDFGTKSPHFGFSASPLAYKGKLIIPGGTNGTGLMAFDLKSGSVIWKNHDFEDVYSSPTLINVDGQDQIALLINSEVVGINPDDGKIVWRHQHENQWKTNISTPIFGDDNILYVTSGGEAGSRGLKLSRKDGKTNVEEIWTTRKVAIGQGNVVRVKDHIYGVTGDGPAFFSCTNVKNGDIEYRKRGFAKAMVLHADGKFIVLDEKGNLALVKATPGDFEVASQINLFGDRAWTIPTLVGDTLFVRDNKKIMALDIG